jgi:hypothetical protein
MGDLENRVRQLLDVNRVLTSGGRWRYTRPAQRTYPHQWLWDSCFHAMIWHWLGDSAMARDELRAAMREQVTQGPDRGRVPHMTFFGADAADAAQDEAAAAQYARDVALWGNPRASSITQPPLLAMAALEVGEVDFWREMWPGLSDYHGWWLRRRRAPGSALVICHHVWETGADATPRADAAFARLLATGRTPRALDKGTVNVTAKKRADLLAARFLMLEDLQDIDAAEVGGALDEAEADARRRRLYGHVAIEMQAFQIANLEALARIGEAIGEQAGAARWRAEAAAIADAVNRELWDETRGLYLDRWGEPAARIDVVTYAPILALAAEALVPRERAERLLGHLRDPDAFATRWPLPTVARREPVFDADEYWRGSTWLSVNWFTVRGLAAAARRHGDARFADTARDIARRTLELIDQVGFREYYRSGAARAAGDAAVQAAGFGPDGFGWSGLALDLARMLDDELA